MFTSVFKALAGLFLAGSVSASILLSNRIDFIEATRSVNLYPKYLPTSGDNRVAALQRFIQYARAEGYHLAFGPPQPPLVWFIPPTGILYGQIIFVDKYIFINKHHLEVNGQLEVLLHELGHMFQPINSNRVTAELFAESFAFAVARGIKFDNGYQATTYLLQFDRPTRHSVLIQNADMIQEAAEEVLRYKPLGELVPENVLLSPFVVFIHPLHESRDNSNGETDGGGMHFGLTPHDHREAIRRSVRDL